MSLEIVTDPRADEVWHSCCKYRMVFIHITLELIIRKRMSSMNE